MKIIDKSKNFIRFECLPQGTVFIYGGKYYLKTSSIESRGYISYNAVSLEDSNLSSFDDYEPVLTAGTATLTIE